MPDFPTRYFHGDPQTGRTRLQIGDEGDTFGPLIYLSGSARTASMYAGSTGSVYCVELDVTPAQAIDVDLSLAEQPEHIQILIKEVAQEIVDTTKARILMKERNWSIFSRPTRFEKDMFPYGIRQVALPIVDGSSRLLASNTWRVINGLAHAACEDELGTVNDLDHRGLFQSLEQRGIRMLFGHAPAEAHGGTCDNGIQYGLLDHKTIRSIRELDESELKTLALSERSSTRRYSL